MNINSNEKYGSMLRAYDRLKKIYTDSGAQLSNSLVKDATEDFFYHCYHLKDFIKKETNDNSKKNKIEEYINNSTYLSIAADFCNTFKHGGLDKKSRYKYAIQATNTHIKFDINSNGFIGSSKFEICINNEKYDSLNLAENCIKEWDDFLLNNT